MATQSGASSPPHQRWRPAPQAFEQHKKEEEEDRKFAAAKSSGPQPYRPWSGPSVKLRVPPVNKTASTGESEQASSTYTRRGADNAREATRESQHDPPSSTKASSTATNSDAQRPASETTYSQPGDSQSTRRTTTARTVSFDDRPSDSPMSTSSVPPGRPQPPQERTPPRLLSTDKTTGSQKATVESDVDEDATDSQVEKGSNRPPASTTNTPVSTKAVVDDTSSSKTAEEQPIPLEREHRLYSQAVNERTALRPTTPTSDGTRSTRQDMESNDRKRTQEVQEQRKRLQEDNLRQKREAEERQKREAAEQRERERVKEEERQRAEAHDREVQEQREREKQRQEMEARDREREKQLQEAEHRKRLQQIQEAERLRKKQEDEQRERSHQSERIKKEQEEFARRAEEATRRHQERKRTEDDEKERERWRRATGSSSGGGTPHQSSSGGGTSGFPGSPPPFGSFGPGFPASPASFSSAGSASTQDVAAAWEKYDKAWTELKEKAAQEPLRWRDIPWPMAVQPLKSADLDNGAIANFVLSPTHSKSNSPKERIREALLRWHPDRFESRWLTKCAEKDREEIKAGVDSVAGCLNELLKRPTLPLAP